MQTVEEQVSAILSAAGFTPMPAGEMRGLMVKACAGGDLTVSASIGGVVQVIALSATGF